MKRLFAIILATAALGLVSAGAQAAASDQTIKECENCHGDNGVSQDKNYPTIAGMSAWYLDNELHIYRDEARPCPETDWRVDADKKGKTTMCKEVKDLTDDQIAAIADHFAAQEFVPAKQPYDAAQAKIGKQLQKQRCDKCHSEYGTYADDDAGILLGQWRPYIEESMKEFKSGKRPMPEKMKPKFDSLNDAEMAAIIEFYASGTKNP